MKLTPTSTKCVEKSCKNKGGALFDVTPMVAARLGFIHLKCDRCGGEWALRLSDFQKGGR